MLFNSYVFILAFFPVCSTVWYLLNHFKKYTLGKISLLVSSLIFYAYYNISYAFIIISSILINYLLSHIMICGTKQVLRKTAFVFGLLFNVGLIAYYKYFDFFIDNINFIFKSDLPLKHILMPLGISFFTFQQLSYVIDSYKKDIPKYSLLDYSVFVLFYPQLIAGPIVLHDEIIPQISSKTNKAFNFEIFSRGFYLFTLGLAKKVLIADFLSKFSSFAFDATSQITSADAWIGVLAYTFQIYFDFQGYSMMAMGLGEMLGFRIPRNFRHPYMATSVTDFWRRWHMTLSGWFKNYVYIPLGGSRHGKVRMLFNMFVVWSLTGLWHGAGWNFILWGMYYFALLMIEKLFLLRFFEKYPVVGWCFTFPAVVTGWVIFASDNLSAVKTYLMQMFGHLSDAGYWTMNLDLFGQTVRQYGIYLVLAFIFSTAWPYGKYRENKNRPLTILILLVLFGLCVYKMQTAASNPFLYFRF